MRFSLLTLAGTLLTALTTMSFAQPIPVEGTDQVPNEYGTTFPREITWKADGSRMILIPHGTFKRGAEESEVGTTAEGPVREITLPSFYIDKYEVSNARYQEFILNTAAARPRPSGNKGLIDPERPVVGIPWNSAQGFAEWSGKILPTEAMWEKAARGPNGDLYIGGEVPTDKTKIIFGLGQNGLTAPVEQNTGDVSGYGIYHMAGNVSEFVQDWYLRDYYANAPATNPMGPETSESKAYRGGSYLSRPEQTRLTIRNGVGRALVRDEIGFRTAWVPRPVDSSMLPTPTPSPIPETPVSELVARMIEKLTPFMKENKPSLPREMMAGRAHMGTGKSSVQFVNFTPYRLGLTFVNRELVYKYNEPMSEMTYRNVELPTEVDLYVIAWAPDAPVGKPVNLGFVRAESKATVIFRTEFFGNVVEQSGTKLTVQENPKAEQMYSAFNPLWNQMEVFNTLNVPLRLNVADMSIRPNELTPVGEYFIDPKESLRLTLNPGRYQFRSNYLGATKESSNPVEIRLDDKAARRMLLLNEDKKRPGGVTVITKRFPWIGMEVREAKAIPAPR